MRMTPDGADYGRVMNAISWVVGRYVVRRSADRPINELFRQFGLPERREPMLSTGQSPLLNLVAISPQVLPRDPLWPSSFEQTGFWFHDETDFRPDRALLEFVASGPPPVVITFGAVGEVAGPAMMRAAVSAVTATGQRAILQTGERYREMGSIASDVLRVGYVPHAWLFPRASCVVTHGGAGTTAAAFRAGVPPVTVYHYGDQRYWGLQAERLGVAPRPLSRSSFGIAKLAERIRVATGSEALRVRARALGERIRAEDGVREAATVIERYFPLSDVTIGTARGTSVA